MKRISNSIVAVSMALAASATVAHASEVTRKQSCFTGADGKKIYIINSETHDCKTKALVLPKSAEAPLIAANEFNDVDRAYAQARPEELLSAPVPGVVAPAPPPAPVAPPAPVEFRPNGGLLGAALAPLDTALNAAEHVALTGCVIALGDGCAPAYSPYSGGGHYVQRMNGEVQYCAPRVVIDAYSGTPYRYGDFCHVVNGRPGYKVQYNR